MAMKADRQYEIVKAEGFNNNRHGGEAHWVVYIDRDFQKPYVFKKLRDACRWVEQFSEPEHTVRELMETMR